MISPVCFTGDWLREHAEAMKARDVKNLEKCVLALELVGRMHRAGLDFIFKGGTSLALVFDPVRRLSIDVDILSLEPVKKLREVLESVTKENAPFVGWEHQDHRDREAPPTRHFRALYSSALDPTQLHGIQIDVIHAENPYATVAQRSLQATFITVEEDVRISVPSPSSLLGDKISAFAPSTIGYPYQPIVASTGEPGEPRPIKVVKHLFDVGELATLASDMGETIRTYRRIHSEQTKYRHIECSIDQALADTQDAAFWVARVDSRPREENDKIEFFRKGIRAMDSHLFSQPFHRAESRLAAGRAALIAELIRTGQENFDLPAFVGADPDLDAMREAQLGDPWNNLNRLKQTDLRAFACWHRAQEIGKR